MHRPLPHLIGSRSFYQEDDVGIGDLMTSGQFLINDIYLNSCVGAIADDII